MTKFDKALFQYGGGYLTYGPNRKFVARFKYRGGDKAGFQAFLIKNFTVEEYFGLTDWDKLSPVEALKTKGYVSRTVKNILKEFGYEQTLAGFDQYIQDGIARRAAAQAQEAPISTLVLFD